jgi:peptide/nickel transport system ATP-binding protein
VSIDLSARRDTAPGDLVATIRGLRVEISGGRDVVDDIDLDIHAGQIVGLVGESGSGKTTVSMVLLGYARRGASIVGGTAEILGQDLIALPEPARRGLRGDVVAYVPQDPAAALNPGLKVARQLSEVMEEHRHGVASAEVANRMREVLTEVGLPAEATLGKYPHQLSGGQQQRVAIAMALMLKPNVLVLDEPTTGLDVTTQTRILGLLRQLCEEHSIGALYVTHDLSVIAEIADQVMVMYAGRIVETGHVSDVFAAPRHPYTRALLGSVPDVRERTELSIIPGRAAPPGRRPAGCAFHPRCPIAETDCETGDIPPLRQIGEQYVRCLRAEQMHAAAPRVPVEARVVGPDRPVTLSVRDLAASYRRSGQVLHHIDFDLYEGECLAIVGESGSGKSTLSRCVIGLHEQQTGTVRFRGTPLARSAQQRSRIERQALQYIFQSPFNSLNPRKTVAQILATAHINFFGRDRAAAHAASLEALDRVGLSSSQAAALPDELSGGERQRVAIARALICRPQILLCDEVTSALDVSVQAAVLELLRSLQRDVGLSMVFVTHNLAVVRNIADRVLVMHDGRVVEDAPVGKLLDDPQDDYTKNLLDNTPTIAVA